jgi:hypothetical protein
MYTPTKRAYVPNPDIERRIAERDAFNAKRDAEEEELAKKSLHEPDGDYYIIEGNILRQVYRWNAILSQRKLTTEENYQLSKCLSYLVTEADPGEQND